MMKSYQQPTMLAVVLRHCQMLCESTVIGPGADNEEPVREEHHFNDNNIWDEEW